MRRDLLGVRDAVCSQLLPSWISAPVHIDVGEADFTIHGNSFGSAFVPAKMCLSTNNSGSELVVAWTGVRCMSSMCEMLLSSKPVAIICPFVSGNCARKNAKDSMTIDKGELQTTVDRLKIMKSEK